VYWLPLNEEQVAAKKARMDMTYKRGDNDKPSQRKSSPTPADDRKQDSPKRSENDSPSKK
jgi:hypothetical protein